MGEIKTGVSLLSDKKTSLVSNSLIISKMNLIPNEFKPYLEEIQVLLIELNNLGLLDTFNKESIDLVEILWLNCYPRALQKPEEFIKLSFFEIMKYILIPYNEKHCEQESEFYEYQYKFECFIYLLQDVLKHEKNRTISELLKKYNERLYSLILLLSEIQSLLNGKVNNRYVIKNIIRMFGVYYFTQDSLECNLQIFKQVIVDTINNYPYFVKYCASNGVFTHPITPEEINSTYQSISGYLQFKIKEEKEKIRK